MSGARRALRFTCAEALPTADDVLLSCDLPEASELAPRTRVALDDALVLLGELAQPCALVEDISYPEFAQVYRASQPECDDTPVARVAPRADALALFAATLGEAPTRRTHELFARHDPVRGYLLDAAASLCADRLATLAAASFACTLAGREGARGESAEQARGVTATTRVLPYSPGYCGWPTAGQRALFARLCPEEIGVALNESCLMWPLKSVSGLLAAGPASVHAFDDDFAFCRACATHACRARLAGLGASAWKC